MFCIGYFKLLFYIFQVALCEKKLISDDVFILDLGLTFYQWNGTGSSKDERFKVSWLDEKCEILRVAHYYYHY